jgi:hypothetical protein
MLFLILFGIYSADENVKELEEINEATKGHQGDAEGFHGHLIDQEHGIFRLLNEKLDQLNQEAQQYVGKSRSKILPLLSGNGFPFNRVFPLCSKSAKGREIRQEELNQN